MGPRLGLRWPGFRKVRGQVCKRVGRRLRAVGLDDVAAYRAYLETHPAERLVFTYFDEPLQHACLARIAERLRPRGLLVLGKHEVLPTDAPGFMALDEHNRIYQRVDV